MSESNEVLVFYADEEQGKEQYSVERGAYRGVNYVRVINNHEGESFEETYDNKRIDTIFSDVLDEFRPDIVHCQHLMNLSANIIQITKERGIPVVVTLHEFWMMCPFGGQRLRPDLSICRNIHSFRCAECVLIQRGILPNRYHNSLFPCAQGESNRLSVQRDSSARRLLRRLRQTVLYTRRILKRTEYLRAMLAQADLLVAPSPFLRNEFLRWGVSPERIIFSDYGHHANLSRGFQRTPSSQVRFAYIGTIVPHKGVHVLVEAFNKIEHPNASLRIYGDMTRFPQYGRHVITLARNPNISFCGEFDSADVKEIFENIDVLIVPSLWYENSPLTIHEAFLTRTPVIASNHGGMADLVKHMQNGLLFEVGNPDELAQTISSLVEQPGLLEKLRAGIGPVKTIEEDVLSFLTDRYKSLIKTGQVR